MAERQRAEARAKRRLRHGIPDSTTPESIEYLSEGPTTVDVLSVWVKPKHYVEVRPWRPTTLTQLAAARSRSENEDPIPKKKARRTKPPTDAPKEGKPKVPPPKGKKDRKAQRQAHGY